MRSLRRFAVSAAILALIAPFLYLRAPAADAAVSMSVSVLSSIVVGNDLTVNINVDTGGQSANAFQGTISYPAGEFDGVRGSFSGSVCSLPVVQPNPSSGTATFSCGAPGGFNGSGLVATIVLLATNPGSGTLGLGSCTVLANDGLGTDITGGCSSSNVTVTGAPTPTPTPASTPTPTVHSTPTPTPHITNTPTGTNTIQSTRAAETPTPTPAPTPTPTPPPAVVLPAGTPTPSAAASTSQPTDSSTTTAKRSIPQAFRDMFASIQAFKLSGQDYSGTAALMLTLLPFMALLFAIVFFAYRLFLLERRRRRTMDRLFEMELSELAALEGKMDLLAEKGPKGREEYRDEFDKAKEHILRQLRPDYGKPVDTPAEVKAAMAVNEPPKEPPAA